MDVAECSGLCVSEVRGLFDPSSIQDLNGNVSAISKLGSVFSCPVLRAFICNQKILAKSLGMLLPLCHRCGKV